jgi:signal transduction histidine kinase
LNSLVRESLKLFEAQIRTAGVSLRLELAPDVRAIQADPGQLGRALQNLVLNALDAMPSGGTLTVRTVSHEGGARLEVADTGQGLTQEECDRLFTPYYSTKSHGTGLGLAIVQSVVSDHGGRIAVRSEPGRGATFQIDLL